MTEIYSLQIEASTKKVKALHYAATKTSSNLISTTGWNSVLYTATYQKSLGLYSFLSVTLNGAYSEMGIVNTGDDFYGDNTIVVRLGGPPTVNAIISGVEIYNPGSHYTASSKI